MVDKKTGIFLRQIYVPSNNCLKGEMKDASDDAVGCDESSSVTGCLFVFFCLPNILPSETTVQERRSVLSTVCSVEQHVTTSNNNYCILLKLTNT
jgi:hypothetical protein